MELGKTSGSSKQSKKKAHTEVIYRIKGRSSEIHKFPKLRVWNGSSDHFEMYPERIDRRGSRSSDSDTNPDVIDISLSSQFSASQPDDTIYEFPTAKSDSISSSPPRSSDDLFQVNMKRDIKPASEKVYVMSRNSSSSSEDLENNSPHLASMSPVSDVTNEFLMPIISPTQSPPVQVMDRSSGYDPSRIPPSAFARSRSMTPQEWSVASNDSLFSIHIGNASFARENAAIRDNNKSAELKKSCELPPPIPHPPSPIAAFKTDNRPKSPSIPGVEIELFTKETEKSGAIQVAAVTTENSKKAPPVNQKNENKSGAISSKSSKKSKQLDGIRDKVSPLPVRKKRSCCSCLSCSSWSCSWSFCSCPRPKCRWPSCSFKWISCFRWPTCCFRWPNCSCCKCSWPTRNCCTRWSWDCCHCWSCSMNNCCCHCSSDLVDGDEPGGSKPKAGKACKDSTSCCCTKPVSSCCSCSKPSCRACCSKPTCCSTFRLSSCFSCCKWPCSYCCRGFCC